MNWPKIRAWGWYATFIRTPWFCIKLLRFKAGHALSMQRHFHRAEMWTIIKGKGAMFGERGHERNLSWLEGVLIPKGAWHKFVAFDRPVYILEIQYGRKVTEKDIERK